MHKKGLSTVVTTLIVILLVLVAIGIIWVVFKGIIDRGTKQADILSECPFIDLKINSVENCALDTDITSPADGTLDINTKCDVTVERKAGGIAIDGIRFVVTDGTESVIVNQGESVGGDLEEYAVKKFSLVYTADALDDAPTKVIVAPYFLQDGEIKPCQNSRTYTLS